MTVKTDHPRYVQANAEGLWFELYDHAGLDGVRDVLVELGVERVAAGRIAWFVRDHRDRRDDGLSEGTRVNYRRVLRALVEEPDGHNPGSRRPPIMSVGPNMQVAA